MLRYMTRNSLPGLLLGAIGAAVMAVGCVGETSQMTPPKPAGDAVEEARPHLTYYYIPG